MRSCVFMCVYSVHWQRSLAWLRFTFIWFFFSLLFFSFFFGDFHLVGNCRWCGFRGGWEGDGWFCVANEVLNSVMIFRCVVCEGEMTSVSLSPFLSSSQNAHSSLFLSLHFFALYIDVRCVGFSYVYEQKFDADSKHTTHNLQTGHRFSCLLRMCVYPFFFFFFLFVHFGSFACSSCFSLCLVLYLLWRVFDLGREKEIL